MFSACMIVFLDSRGDFLIQNIIWDVLRLVKMNAARCSTTAEVHRIEKLPVVNTVPMAG